MTMNNKRLAIVIPAYKGDYFEETMASIAGQTCVDFTLYIGNDAGSWDIDKVVEKYKDKIDIVYKRFDNNMGGEDLVGEWNRTLSLMGEETFFMLFSDDDVMEPDCIRRFYEELEKFPTYDVYHFNISIINSKSETMVTRNGFPKVMYAQQFYIDNNIYERVDAKMPEFVFRTSKFRETGGFVRFPLAMRTDNATVMNVAKRGGILTIEGPRIKWRRSGKNVGVLKNEDRDRHIRYLEAYNQFDNWLYKDFFIPLSPRDKWANRLRTLMTFANSDLKVTMKQRIDHLLRTEDIKRHTYLCCAIPILWLIKKTMRLLIKRA